MAAKKKFLIENDYSFFLFGISCGEKPYRLCWALNNQMNATFSKSNDIEMQGKNNSDQLRFPVFAFRNEEIFADYRIIVNKTENKHLVSEYKQADYLLLIQGEIPFAEKNSILKKIKEITFVQTVFEIDANKIKNKEYFIL